MAKRRKRRSTTRRRKQQNDYPGWVWMMFGLAIGLSVAFAIYVKDREPIVVATNPTPAPASLQSAIDDNGETDPVEPPPDEPAEQRFTFYDMLPLSDVTVEDEKPVVDKDVTPVAVEEPGIYMLQAGSFSTHADAEKRRAELGLHGIESHIGRATVNGKKYHRVYIGPIENLNVLNLTRSRLRAAKIDVLRIRLGQ